MIPDLPETTVPGQRKKVFEFIMAELDTITNLFASRGTKVNVLWKIYKRSSICDQGRRWI